MQSLYLFKKWLTKKNLPFHPFSQKRGRDWLAHQHCRSDSWKVTYLAASISVEQLGYVRAHVHSLQGTLEALGIDADGEGCHPGERAIVFHTFWSAL